MKDENIHQREDRLEADSLNIRRCPVCGKALAEVNPGPNCFSCLVPKVIDIDSQGNIFKRPITFKVMSPVSVCTSRETPGFKRVYVDYHGWGKGL